MHFILLRRWVSDGELEGGGDVWVCVGDGVGDDRFGDGVCDGVCDGVWVGVDMSGNRNDKGLVGDGRGLTQSTFPSISPTSFPSPYSSSFLKHTWSVWQYGHSRTYLFSLAKINFSYLVMAYGSSIV